MVKLKIGLVTLIILGCTQLQAQCSMCTKTAQQLGEKPAQGLNAGILYLMLTPFLIMIYVGWRWWKNEKIRTANQ